LRTWYQKRPGKSQVHWASRKHEGHYSNCQKYSYGWYSVSWKRNRVIVNAGSAHIRKLALSCHEKRVPLHYHRFSVASPMRPSAPDKKIALHGQLSDLCVNIFHTLEPPLVSCRIGKSTATNISKRYINDGCTILIHYYFM
jgi:hypothetical protein